MQQSIAVCIANTAIIHLYSPEAAAYSMKRKWNNNYEKEMQKTHNNSDTSHELKRALKL